jgi:ATP-dependent 26S proteasome regulatory subunit
MTELTEWQKNNEAYLAAAFKWLRLCLMSLAPPPPVLIEKESSPAGDYQDVEVQYWSFYQQRKAESEEPGSFNALQTQIAEAAAAFEAAANVEPQPALIILGERLGLSRFEREVLLLCAALELDTRFAGLCARAHDDPNKSYPTFALALALLDEPMWDALSPQRPLRYLHLLEINQPAAQPLTSSALRIEERVLNFIKGLNEFDDRLMSLLVAIDAPEIGLPPSQQSIAQKSLRAIHDSASNSSARLPLIELTGIDSASKQIIASQIAGVFDLSLYRLPVEMLPVNTAELETLARLWQREILLKPTALYLDASELNLETQSVVSLQRFITQSTGLTFLDIRAAWKGAGEEIAVFDVLSPTPAEQKEAWITGLDGGLNDEIADDEAVFLASRLANQFNLNLPAIYRISQNALAPRTEEAQLCDVVWEMCLASTRPRLDMLAQRLEPKAKWDEIVLPDEASMLLEQIVEQVLQRGTVYDEWGFRARMNRGFGISALFAGESGTGKTMAAEVIANELRLNLYRIDLSAVVNKYIGETEKNLRRLFDTAEEGGAILFFDEADALFGKRSEVKDSHDRYANIEINYLLQRLESYRGLAILATNMKSALDTAFMRRLRFIVDFPFPGRKERAKIWEKVFPPDTPVYKIDHQRLAGFNLSGGSIHNIALSAAFRATSTTRRRVTMRLIFDAVRTEFNKLGLPSNEADFALPPDPDDEEEQKKEAEALPVQLLYEGI